MCRQLLGIAALFMTLGGFNAASAQTYCRPADATSNLLTAHVGEISSATVGDDKIVRDSLRLPLVQTSQIAVVTQEATCKKANAAFQAWLANRGGTSFSGRVYVLRIGTVYAVHDPVYRYRAGEDYTPIVFLDSRLKFLSAI